MCRASGKVVFDVKHFRCEDRSKDSMCMFQRRLLRMMKRGDVNANTVVGLQMKEEAVGPNDANADANANADADTDADTDLDSDGDELVLAPVESREKRRVNYGVQHESVMLEQSVQQDLREHVTKLKRKLAEIERLQAEVFNEMRGCKMHRCTVCHE